MSPRHSQIQVFLPSISERYNHKILRFDIVIKKLLKEILPNPYRGDYFIGFVDKPDIVRNSDSWYDKVKWVNVNKYKKDGWFADPFFYNVTDNHIILFAEQMFSEINRGRLVKMTIRRKDYYLEEVTPILTLEPHLSFPIIWRENGKEYVYPENEQSGSLKIYELDPTTQKLHSPKVLINERLIDSQIAKLGNEYFIFGVVLATGAWSDTRNLQVYKSNHLLGPYTHIQTIESENNCERGAGLIIPVDNSTILRPAQNCNGAYGKETIMYQMEYDGCKFSEKELYRITPNKRMRNGEVLHTYNEYNDLCVIDGLQHHHPVLYKLVKLIKPNVQI